MIAWLKPAVRQAMARAITIRTRGRIGEIDRPVELKIAKAPAAGGVACAGDTIRMARVEGVWTAILLGYSSTRVG